jgi:hypothetical protein
MKFICVLLIAVSSHVALAFDLPSMPSAPSLPDVPKAATLPTANPEVEGKVDSFIKKSDEANQFMNKSVAALFSIIAPKDKQEIVSRNVTKAETLQDAKQKADLLKKLNLFRSQVVNKTLNDEKAMGGLGNLSAQDKVSLGKVLYNLHLATLLYKDVGNEGPAALKAAASDPVMLKRADEIKNSINESKAQLTNGQNLIVGVTKLTVSNGVKVDLPKSASDSPQ